MEALGKIVAFIQQLQKKEFQNYLMIALAGVSFVTGVILYTVYTTSEELIIKMKKIDELAKKTSLILATHEKMKIQEDRYQSIIEKNKDFTLSGEFEKFCREQNITPEPGWVPSTNNLNVKFDEMSLLAIFKGLTTEKLVGLLDALDKKELLYVKDLKIKNTGSKQISCEITIATNKYKTSFE